ncbi:helix-turn-helix domain-containing protein [Paraburkholderia nemoris]|uniref:helix-turn-helix domain-containing protein n=1 Tax=Paraburkholderia nemoris TaxID=2793076 RepID=UPI001B04C8C4|nr:helix-turn-helix domain-containing protein [Paraburkholderia nemoris]CAE6822245.1 hypothetical protein R75777_06206 [Paraburkholderia nemoris]
MKTTVEYLDAVKAKLDLPSDYAAAKALGVTRAAVSRYRNGIGTFDDLTAARVADVLGIEPIEVIAATNYERSTDERARAVWGAIWGKAVGTTVASLLLAVAGLSVVPSTKAAESGNTVISLSYVKLRIFDDTIKQAEFEHLPLVSSDSCKLLACLQKLTTSTQLCPQASATSRCPWSTRLRKPSPDLAGL